MPIAEAVASGLVSGAVGAAASGAVRDSVRKLETPGFEPGDGNAGEVTAAPHPLRDDPWVHDESFYGGNPARDDGNGDTPDPAAPPPQPDGEPSFGEVLARLMEPGETVAIPYPVDGPAGSAAPPVPWQALGLIGALGVGGVYLWRRFA